MARKFRQGSPASHRLRLLGPVLVYLPQKADTKRRPRTDGVMDTGATSGGPQSTDLEPGTVVNGLYRLVRLLGVGGMGEVWEARQERKKGRVALKLLLPEMGRHVDHPARQHR